MNENLDISIYDEVEQQHLTIHLKCTDCWLGQKVLTLEQCRHLEDCIRAELKDKTVDKAVVIRPGDIRLRDKYTEICGKCIHTHQCKKERKRQRKCWNKYLDKKGKTKR